MKAVVTGSEGFIGSHLVDYLIERGWYVQGIDDWSTHKKKYNGRPNTTHYMGTLGSARNFRPEDDTDVIFHLAGKVGPVGVIQHAGHIAIDTIETADRMGFEADRLHIPLIDISTSEVYGSPDSLNSEDDPKVFRSTSPRAEYALAKLAAEVMLQNRQNLDVRIIRPFNVAGPRQRPEGGFVLPRFVQSALRDAVVPVYAPGTARRAFTHVRDIVDGIMLAYTNGKRGEVYNLGNPDNATTIMELAEEVVGLVGKGHIELVDPVELHGPRFKEAPDKLPNADKAIRELGWHPRFDTIDIIQDVINWERKQ